MAIATNLVKKAAEASINDHVKYGLVQVAEDLDETKTKLSRIVNAYVYKGTVATVDDLPTTDNHAGDVYNVESDGGNYAWDGTQWDALGSSLTLEAGNGIAIRDGVISTSIMGDPMIGVEYIELMDETTAQLYINDDTFRHTVRECYTAGDGISISEDGVISVSYPVITEV